MTKRTNLPPDPVSWPDGAGMIYIGMSPWEGMWKNRHQLMSRFADQLPVLYVEPPQRLRKLGRAVLAGKVSPSDFRGMVLQEVRPGLHVLGNSPLFAVSGSGLLQRWTTRRWRRAIYRAANKAGIRKPIVWISQPDHSALTGQKDELLSIYHVVDEYSGYTGLDSAGLRKLRAMERSALESVDLTIVVSPELMRDKSGSDRDVRLVENAADVSRFEAARASAAPPPELADVPGPRFGYSGLIGKRLDLGLVSELAREHQEWSFVFIGRVDRRECEAELTALEEMHNVFFLGEKKPDRVPDYMVALDVGLLPYELNVETEHISPLKMYEYLAAGLPVVSTAIPAALRHRSIVSVADDANEFARACQGALTNECLKQKQERLEFSRENTWDRRVDELTEIIFGAIKEKNGTSTNTE